MWLAGVHVTGSLNQFWVMEFEELQTREQEGQSHSSLLEPTGPPRAPDAGHGAVEFDVSLTGLGTCLDLVFPSPLPPMLTPCHGILEVCDLIFLPACVYVFCTCAWCPRRAEEGIRSPVT